MPSSSHPCPASSPGAGEDTPDADCGHVLSLPCSSAARFPPILLNPSLTLLYLPPSLYSSTALPPSTPRPLAWPNGRYGWPKSYRRPATPLPPPGTTMKASPGHDHGSSRSASRSMVDLPVLSSSSSVHHPLFLLLCCWAPPREQAQAVTVDLLDPWKMCPLSPPSPPPLPACDPSIPPLLPGSTMTEGRDHHR